MKSDTEYLIKALRLEKEGSWDEAHRIVQVRESKRACRVHAYLHRKEGDLANATYWYRRAGETIPEIDLDQEWQNLYDFIV